ncbi:MAG: alpha/beta fold hydrolase [Nitriliruptor sp.]
MASAVTTTDHETDPAGSAGALDLVLTQAGLSPLQRFVPGLSGVRFAARLAGQPRTVARRGASLALELGRIAAGVSTLSPSRRDRRFRDDAWSGNPTLRRLVQAYLATGETLETLLADADLDWEDEERVGLVLDNLIQALAPSNNPFLNPSAWKTAIDTGGASFVRGVRHLVDDMATSPRIPSSVPPGAFEVGRDLAVTPGAVILRTDVFELIQYTPQTPQVQRTPLLIVPPTINKYYIADLAPGRSFVEYLVQQGHQVLIMSWRNPDARHAAWDLDTYGEAVLTALDATKRITHHDRVHLLGVCAGGIITAMVLAHLAAEGSLDEQVATANFAVTLLDQEHAGTTGAMVDEQVAAVAVAASQARGYLDGRKLAEVFAWLRPNDLIWNYWVNNYLQGKTPPKFDILHWNGDSTRMTAGLHRDFMDIALQNQLTVPGTACVLGTPVDLRTVTLDSYVTAGIADHICPWESCYQTTQLLGGRTRFVLSTSGHIASIVNPPGNPKAQFQVSEHNPEDPGAWVEQASTQQGSWWPDFVAWLEARGDGTKRKPNRLGAAGFDELDPAPGTYVLDS